MKYLLDTNICIYFLKGKFGLVEKFDQIGFENLYISEITVAELKYGAAKSDRPAKNKSIIEKLVNSFQQIPIFNSFRYFCRRKGKTQKRWKSCR